jgi:hypothetical protein
VRATGKGEDVVDTYLKQMFSIDRKRGRGYAGECWGVSGFEGTYLTLSEYENV